MQQNDASSEIRARLTAPGAPFELIETVSDGVSQRLYRNAPKTFPEMLNAARSHGDKPYIVYRGETWSFNRVFKEADALAAHMQSWGVKPGDRVAIAMRNRPEWGVAFIAAALIGAIPSPLNSFGLKQELSAALSDIDASVLFCDPERLDRLGGYSGRHVVVEGGALANEGYVYADLVVAELTPLIAPQLTANDPALILFTSGATSRAKGVLSSQQAVCQALFNIDYIGALCATASPQVVAAIMARQLPPTILTAVPLFHVSGLMAQLLSALRNGRRLVFMHRWDPAEAINMIRAEKITQFNGAPAMVMQLIADPRFGDPEWTGSLGGVGFGGGGLPQRLIDEVLARMPNSMSGIGFGMTESNGTGTAASGDLFCAQPRSSGLISPLVDLRVVDEAGNSLPCNESGEICLRGVSMMQGYLNDSEATRATIREGWLHTGDIGYLDEHGYLFVVDRIKDVINRFGEKIAAAEVESCLLDLSGVEETAVFALPDEACGESVCAAIVLRPGVKLDVADVQSHVASRLAAYKVPTKVYIRADPLPRNPAGKLLKRSLRKEYLQT